MALTDEALAAYYEVRARAEQRSATLARGAPPAFDPLRTEVEARSRALYEERLGTLDGLVVGEVGVGGGDFARYACTHGVRALILVDISRDRLAALDAELVARAGRPNVKLIVADAQSLDGLGDAELDLLVAKEVIEHLKDYRPFLTACRRVVRPGGRLYLTTPNRNSVDLWLRNALARFRPAAKRRGPALIRQLFGDLFERLEAEEVTLLAELLPPGFKEHIHEFAPAELARCLAEHGFRVLRHWGTPPQMFYHELRPLARRLLPAWNRAADLSYALGDDLRVIAERTD